MLAKLSCLVLNLKGPYLRKKKRGNLFTYG